MPHLLVASVLLVSGIACLHFACLHWWARAELDPYDLSDFYPLSVFKLRRPSLAQLGFALLCEGAFLVAWRRISRRLTPLAGLFAIALSFAVLSNLLHGWRYGIDYPTATSGDSGIEYYHDAILIRGPLWFLSRFNAIQFELLEHARTHPPGPVLLYYALYRSLQDPGLISIGVTALWLGLALPYLRRLWLLVFGEAPPTALFLYALLPANLIYGLATVDAPIAALFLATVVCFVDDQRPRSLGFAVGWLSLSACFTFGALFLIPVCFGFELVRRRSVKRSLLLLVASALLLASLKPLFGYDWLASFLRASAMENEKGFLLFAEPKRYLWYRLGAVAEIACFFSPFLLLLWARGWPALRRASQDGWALAWLGPLSLAGLLLSGAMKIGEAARICLFILPFLLLPVVAAFRELHESGRFRVAQAVFVWGLLLQLFGFYQW
jgi:hypothetical protein